MAVELLIYMQIAIIILLLLIIFRSEQHLGRKNQGAMLAFEYMGPLRAGDGPITAGYGAIQPEVEETTAGMCTEAGGRLIPCADLE